MKEVLVDDPDELVRRLKAGQQREMALRPPS
jgi:hypothetical protein